MRVLRLCLVLLAILPLSGLWLVLSPPASAQTPDEARG